MPTSFRTPQLSGSRRRRSRAGSSPRTTPRTRTTGRPRTKAVVVKELLLTWYGITDLRAAVGFETGDGPVVGAVRAHPYTGVVVLGYVRPEEQATDQEAFTRELRSTHEEMERGD